LSGSRHSRGAAVDIALVAADGAPVALPTEHDDFSRRAHRSRALPASIEARRLDRAMLAAGFVAMPTEWWHYDAPDWQSYPLSDEPLTDEVR
jgi:D-alanyl-D-alanine dipeptidase